MTYLERNLQILSEIGEGVALQRGQRIGESRNGTRFTALGHFPSETLNGEAFAGLKEMTTLSTHPNRRDEWTRRRAVLELAIYSNIADNLPHRADQVPSFYGLALDRRQKAMGIVMEDLSQGGAFKVDGMMVRAGQHYPDRQLVKELSNLFGFEVFDWDLGKSLFRTQGSNRIVLADVDQLIDREVLVDKIAEIEKVLPEHTINITHRL